MATPTSPATNGGLAIVLLRAGRRLRSITLRDDAHHLLTDVWTSVGVVLGLIFVPLTGWLVLAPLIAFLVAAESTRQYLHKLLGSSLTSCGPP